MRAFAVPGRSCASAQRVRLSGTVTDTIGLPIGQALKCRLALKPSCESPAGSSCSPTTYKALQSFAADNVVAAGTKSSGRIASTHPTTSMIHTAGPSAHHFAQSDTADETAAANVKIALGQHQLAARSDRSAQHADSYPDRAIAAQLGASRAEFSAARR